MTKPASKARSRLIINCQSTGRIGKSTMQQAVLEWLNYAGVPRAAIDADAEHRTLSQWYPGIAEMTFRTADDLLQIVNACGSTAVEVLDFPAQATDEIIAGIEKFDLVRALEEKSVKLTVLIFASDERPAMFAAAKVAQTLGDAADYLIVRNPARYSSKTFEASKVAEMLKASPVVEMPSISAATIAEVDAACKAQKKALTFAEASKHVPIGSRMELEGWRNRMLTQLEDVANVLVPDVSLIKTKVQRFDKKEKQALSAFDL